MRFRFPSKLMQLKTETLENGAVWKRSVLHMGFENGAFWKCISVDSENGRKRAKMGENGRKWAKMGKKTETCENDDVAHHSIPAELLFWE